MEIRGKETYLSVDVWKGLHILAKSRSPEDGSRIATADEMADTVLRETLADKYPEISEYQQKVAQMEKELIKILGGR